MSPDHFGLYFLAVAVAVLTPGPAIMTGITSSIRYGFPAAMVTALGCVTATGLMGALSAMGLGAVIMASGLLFDIIRYVGAAYLIWLGWRMWANSNKVTVPQNMVPMTEEPRLIRLYLRGFMVSASNPKAIAFFTALFPVFLDPDAPLMAQFLILDGTFMVMSFAAIVGYSALAARSRTFLAGSARRWFDRISGSIFVAFGIALAASHK